MSKVVLIVLDSVGIGAQKDAVEYGDLGADTLGHLFEKVKGVSIPNLINLGLGNIDGVNIPYKSDKPLGAYGKSAEKINAKDTTGGHWEIAGLTLKKPFPVYPNGFPKDVVSALEKAFGRKILGNYAASGTEIIKVLGEEHTKTGYPIVYTSADSVLQIAANEEVIPLEELYGMCKKARQIMTGDHAVGRVIARPFIVKDGKPERTKNRRDFSLEPPGKTMLDILYENGYEVIGIGKIEDIFAKRGITKSIHTTDNKSGTDTTIEQMKQEGSGLIFTNLVDFDMLYGHRNNACGYANALMDFDKRLPEIMNALNNDDILIITADHGCDPTTSSTDHSREYIPILVYGRKVSPGVNLGIRSTFADISATILEFFNLPTTGEGTSFLRQILKGKNK